MFFPHQLFTEMAKEEEKIPADERKRLFVLFFFCFHSQKETFVEQEVDFFFSIWWELKTKERYRSSFSLAVQVYSSNWDEP